MYMGIAFGLLPPIEDMVESSRPAFKLMDRYISGPPTVDVKPQPQHVTDDSNMVPASEVKGVQEERCSDIPDWFKFKIA